MRCAGALLAAVALAACGEKTDTLAPTAAQTQPLNLMLDWLPNADHVGIYQALANGDFTQAGLAVHVHVPTDPATPLQLLAAGKVDAAISYEPQLMLARDAGEPLVAIAAFVQRPLTSIVSLHSKHITTPQDLRGKTVGDAGIPYQQAYLKTILAHAGRAGRLGQGRQRRRQPRRARCCRGAWTRPWARTGTTRPSSCARRARSPTSSASTMPGVPTYDELVVVVRGQRSPTRPTSCAASCRLWAGAIKPCAPNPPAG